LYDILKKSGYYRKKGKNVYFNSKKYRLVFPYKYTPSYPQYNERGRLEHYTCIRLYFNGVNIRAVIRSILNDLNSHVDNIEVVFRFCRDIIKYLEKFYTLPSQKSDYTLKKTKNTVFASAYPDKKMLSYKNQLVDLCFEGGNIDFLRLLEEENRLNYNNEVYGLFKCYNGYFHNLHKNYFFKAGFIDKLEGKLRDGLYFNREYIGKYINLRFEGNRLVVIFKRYINKYLDCSGTKETVLKRFLSVGIDELYDTIKYCDLSREEFDKNIRAENYSQFELAEDIGCNIEKEYPERLRMLKQSRNNKGESLADYGLKYFVRYIDYSRGDKQGRRIPEHEIKAVYPNGASFEDIVRDLKLLEPDFRPKGQMTIDRYLKSNEFSDDIIDYIKEYNKSNVHSIRPFSIGLNPVRNDFTNVEKSIYEIKEFNNLEIHEPIQFNKLIANKT